MGQFDFYMNENYILLQKRRMVKMKIDAGSVASILIYIGSGVLASVIVWLLPLESGAARISVAFFLFWGFMYLGGRLLKSRL